MDILWSGEKRSKEHCGVNILLLYKIEGHVFDILICLKKLQSGDFQPGTILPPGDIEQQLRPLSVFWPQVAFSHVVGQQQRWCQTPYNPQDNPPLSPTAKNDAAPKVNSA